MNKHLWRSLFLLVFLGVVGMIVYFAHVAGENNRKTLQSNLASAISQNKAGEIPFVNFASATPFSWDRLYIFGPYTFPEKIDSSLGSFWVGSRFTSIKSSDRITLLVFTRDGRVVQHLEFPRSQGDFSPAANEEGFPIEESRFIVDERGRMTWTGNK